MSQILVRPYEPRDQEATWQVRAMTYNSGQPIPIEKQVYKTATPYVGEVDGRIVGTFVVMDMTSSRGHQAEWKTAGIAGVAVLPEARQTGIGSAMMRWALRHLRENGYILASLYAFRESYYRKFGYEICGMRYKITCPNARLPRHKAELPLRRIPNDQYQEIQACYEAFAKARSGMNLRNEMHWGRVIGEKQTIYAAGDPVEAYAILEHDTNFWVDQPISELAWSTMRGYESIVSLLGSIGINKGSVTWNEPSDSPFYQRHVDKGIAFEADRLIMFRLLDLPAALSSMKAEGEGEFTIAMHDPDLPENDGPFQVRFAQGSTQVQKTKSAQISLTPQTAVQAILGDPSLAALARNGIVPRCEAANHLLPPLPVYCTEFF